MAEGTTNDRFWRIVALAALIIAGLFVGERYVRYYVFSADEPRVTTPRPDLTAVEQIATEVYAKTAPRSPTSSHKEPVARAWEAGHSRLGDRLGVRVDRAGHIVTNAHVVEGRRSRRCYRPRRRSRGPCRWRCTLGRPCGAQSEQSTCEPPTHHGWHILRFGRRAARVCDRKSVWIGTDTDERNHQRARSDIAHRDRPRDRWRDSDGCGHQSWEFRRSAGR